MALRDTLPDIVKLVNASMDWKSFMKQRSFLVFHFYLYLGSENSSSKSFIIILIVFGCGIAFFLASRYQNRLGRIRLPLDDYTSRHFSLSYYIEAFKDSMISSFYWIYDKIIFLKEEIRYRMNPTPYRYTPVSSIPRPSFEYDDFDD